MVRNHRITARSKVVGKPWYDSKDREYKEYTCGVTAHGQCSHTIKQRTGRKRERQ